MGQLADLKWRTCQAETKMEQVKLYFSNELHRYFLQEKYDYSASLLTEAK